MKFSGERMAGVIITGALLILAIYANFYTIGRMAHYGLQIYLYDKLLVAYREGGGMPALRRELDRAVAQPNMPRQAALAGEFKKNLATLEAPEQFLEEALNQSNKKIKSLRNLRITAFIFILAALLLRLAINFFARGKHKQR